MTRSHMKAVLVGTVAAAGLCFAAQAQQNGGFPVLTIRPADPNDKADGTMSPAARAAIEHGTLPVSAADVAAKAAANRARDAAEKAGGGAVSPAERAAAGEITVGPQAPVIVGGFNKEGLPSNNVPGKSLTPPDTTGAIGPSSFIQLVNGSAKEGSVNANAGIYNRTTGALIGSGTLNELAGIVDTKACRDASTCVKSLDPQVIWDATTNRFYYVMASVFSASNNQLSYGFSNTSNPRNVTTDWCHYRYTFGPVFLDAPKLGDSQFFAIIGANVELKLSDDIKVPSGSVLLGLVQELPNRFSFGGIPFLA